MRFTVGLVMVLSGIALLLVTSLTHADMTATRLFIEFWPRYVLSVALCFGSVFVWPGKPKVP